MDLIFTCGKWDAYRVNNSVIEGHPRLSLLSKILHKNCVLTPPLNFTFQPLRINVK